MNAKMALLRNCTALGVDLVAHGDDGREVVVFGGVGLAVGGSYLKISNN
jgi:hypothetical protein